MKKNIKLTTFLCMITSVLLVNACTNNSNINPSKHELGSITGRVYFDENSNKECDCECGIEDIKIRIYKNSCAESIFQSVDSDEEGYFIFDDLEAGTYCIYPNIPFTCEGFTPTTGINRIIEIKPGESIEAEWFSYEKYVDLATD